MVLDVSKCITHYLKSKILELRKKEKLYKNVQCEVSLLTSKTSLYWIYEGTRDLNKKINLD